MREGNEGEEGEEKREWGMCIGEEMREGEKTYSPSAEEGRIYSTFKPIKL